MAPDTLPPARVPFISSRGPWPRAALGGLPRAAPTRMRPEPAQSGEPQPAQHLPNTLTRPATPPPEASTASASTAVGR